jgi:hypothetical protein
LTIAKSITISCEAGTAGILNVGVDSVFVNVAATDVVYLRGLDINGLGPANTALYGLYFQGAGTLHVEKCLIHGFYGNGSIQPGVGIDFLPAGSASLFVADTVVADNGNPSGGGNIVVAPAGNHVVNVSLERVRMNNGGVGLRADGSNALPLRVEVSDSVASGNIYNGFTATASTGKVTMMLKNVVASNNANIGVAAIGANAKVMIGDSVVSGNTTGVSASGGGTLESFQNNQIKLNGTDGTPLSPVSFD